MDHYLVDRQIMGRIAASGFKPKVIFDVGGSNGAWTSNALQVFPDAKYEMFEPLAEINPAYKTGLAALEKRANVRMHKHAVGATSHTANFNFLGDRGVGSSLLGRPAAGEQAISVKVEPLDALVASNALALPDVIKMDIQGGELEALIGAQDRCLPHAQLLALELWLTRGYGGKTPLLVEIFEFLRREDFYPFEFGDEYRDPEGLLVSKDVWFIRRKSDLGLTIWKNRLDKTWG